MKYWKNGFHEKQSEINDRFEITDEKWIELLDGQSSGLEIYTNNNGEPCLREAIIDAKLEKELKIETLKQKLSESDYKAIKFAEGLISELDYAPIKAERQALRDQINILEVELM